MKLINFLLLIHSVTHSYCQFIVDWNLSFDIPSHDSKLGTSFSDAKVNMYYFLPDEAILKVTVDPDNETITHNYWYFTDTLNYHSIDQFYTDSLQTIVAGQVLIDGIYRQVTCRLDEEFQILWTYQQADEFGPLAFQGIIAKPDTTFLLTYSYLPFTFNNYGYIVIDEDGTVLREELVPRLGAGTVDMLVQKDGYVWMINDFDSLSVLKCTKTGEVVQDTTIAWPILEEVSGGGNSFKPLWLNDTLILYTQKSAWLPSGIQRILYAFKPDSMSAFSFNVLNEPEFYDSFIQWDDSNHLLQDLQVSEDATGNLVALRTAYSSNLEMVHRDSMLLTGIIDFEGSSYWEFDEVSNTWVGYCSHINGNTSSVGQAAILSFLADSTLAVMNLDVAWNILYSNQSEIYQDDVGFILYNEKFPMADSDSIRGELTRIMNNSLHIEGCNSGLASPYIFPNPFHHQLNATELDPGTYTCRLINETGQIIWVSDKMAEGNMMQLNIPFIPSGLYILELANESAVIRKSVIRH
jgi:hypothetical protein